MNNVAKPMVLFKCVDYFDTCVNHTDRLNCSKDYYLSHNGLEES